TLFPYTTLFRSVHFLPNIRLHKKFQPRDLADDFCGLQTTPEGAGKCFKFCEIKLLQELSGTPSLENANICKIGIGMAAVGFSVTDKVDLLQKEVVLLRKEPAGFGVEESAGQIAILFLDRQFPEGFSVIRTSNQFAARIKSGNVSLHGIPRTAWKYLCGLN